MSRDQGVGRFKIKKTPSQGRLIQFNASASKAENSGSWNARWAFLATEGRLKSERKPCCNNETCKKDREDGG